MSALPFVVTAAGKAALVNAENDGTNAVQVTEIGVTESAFTAGESMTDLPGELKRLTSFGGQSVDARTIHVTLRDDGADVYSMRGFGLYLADGALFGLYGQVDPILQKSTQAVLLLQTDVRFQNIDASQITFGNANFLNPPATTEVEGVLELATNEEALAGEDGHRGIVPSALKYVLDKRLGAGAPTTFVKGLLNKATAAAFCLSLGIKSAAFKDAGAGKGLDADLLDGQHGAYYRDYGHLQNVPTSFTPKVHQHSASDITSGILTVARGGIGRGSLTAGSYLLGAGANAVVLKTPSEVRTNIGAAASQHSHNWSNINDPPVFARRWPAWSEVTGKPRFATPAQGDRADAAMPRSGGTFTGTVNFGNGAVTGVGELHFQDPGWGEGIFWDGGNGWGIAEAPDSLGNGSGNLQFGRGNTREMTLTTGGSLWLRGSLDTDGITTHPSDPRLKRDFHRIVVPNDFGDHVALWSWTWSDLSRRAGSRGRGLRSDEVKRLLPQAVYCAADGYDRVNYELVALALGYTAHRRIQALEARLNALESRA